MAKLITKFITATLEVLACLFVICGGLAGLFSAIGEDSPVLMILYIPLGIIAGFIVATIVLGIPLLILRINQNLEEINNNLKYNLSDKKNLEHNSTAGHG